MRFAFLRFAFGPLKRTIRPFATRLVAKCCVENWKASHLKSLSAYLVGSFPCCGFCSLPACVATLRRTSADVLRVKSLKGKDTVKLGGSQRTDKVVKL